MSRSISIGRTRNIGIMAHIDAGKTTTTERILFYTGRSHRIGEVHEGTAIMDWMEQEQERGITITSAATTCGWTARRWLGDDKGEAHQINIIDTPGHIDFTIEVQRSLRVLDGAITVLDGVAGVEPQTETVWRQADKYRVPRIVFVNKLDRVGADFDNCVEMVQSRLGAQTLVMQRPIGRESGFRGLIDLVTMTQVIWSGDSPDSQFDAGPIADELREEADLHREVLLEALSIHDDALLEMLLEGATPAVEQLRAIIRKVTLASAAVPVFCGAAFKNKGVRHLLDAVVDYLPSPSDVPPVTGLRVKNKAPTDELVERPVDDNAPFAALAFKIASDPFVGQLTYFRVYSGTLKTGTVVFNATKGKRERVGRLLRMHANQREDIDACHAGDIVAAVGMKEVTTGDTLCVESHPLLLEKIDFPEPVIRIAIEPKTKADQDKLAEALRRLEIEDPSFRVGVDGETGQTVIAGMGELHLDIIVDRLVREFKVVANVGKPQVAYRETVTVAASGEGRFVRQAGGKGQYGHVILEVSPGERGSGFTLAADVKNDVIPSEYIPAIEAGARSGYESGPLAGFAMADVHVRITGGSYHEVDSSEVAFTVAGTMAFRDACEKASPVILEPVMEVEVVVPEEHVGDVIGQVNAKRGDVKRMMARGAMQFVTADIPLASMFGYATELRSGTQGRGTYTMQFSHYAPVPPAVAKNIVGE
ncbi:MAG: elongation factor G [bacterium]